MKKILAIANIALRSAIRSRIVIMLLLLLVLAVLVLPMTVKSDETASGYVQVLLNYSLGFSLMILSIATLWSGCAGVSAEIEEKQIHLVVTKPVSRLQVWLGKWLALMVMNAVLMAFVGVCVYGVLMWRTGKEAFDEEQQGRLKREILVAKADVKPNRVVPPPGLMENEFGLLKQMGKLPPGADFAELETQQLVFNLWRERLMGEMFREMMAGEILPPDATLEDPGTLTRVRKSLERRENYLPVGEARSWVIEPENLRTDVPLFLDYRFRLGGTDTRESQGVWVITQGTNEVRHAVVHNPQQDERREIPTALIAGTLEPDQPLIVTYENRSQHGSTVMFERSPSLQYQVGSFGGNFIKTLLMMYCQLGLLAAIGLTMGALFSLPVATLASVFILLLLSLSGFLQTLVASPGKLKALQPFYHVLAWVLKPLQGPKVFDLLTSGLAIEPLAVATTMFWKLVIYSGIFCLVGTWLFNKREIGLPTKT